MDKDEIALFKRILRQVWRWKIHCIAIGDDGHGAVIRGFLVGILAVLARLPQLATRFRMIRLAKN